MEATGRFWSDELASCSPHTRTNYNWIVGLSGFFKEFFSMSWLKRNTYSTYDSWFEQIYYILYEFEHRVESRFSGAWSLCVGAGLQCCAFACFWPALPFLHSEWSLEWWQPGGIVLDSIWCDWSRTTIIKEKIICLEAHSPVFGEVSIYTPVLVSVYP